MPGYLRRCFDLPVYQALSLLGATRRVTPELGEMCPECARQTKRPAGWGGPFELPRPRQAGHSAASGLRISKSGAFVNRHRSEALGQTGGIERVGAYIDGFNFYHGLMAKRWGRYRWLDYRALMERYVLPGQTLEFVRYFTTEVRHDPEALQRQRLYLRALEERGGVDVHHGVFDKRQVKCRRCQRWYTRPQEKQTDVNIATHLLMDALDDLFDVFILVSADSDLIPAATTVIQRFEKRMVLIDPPKRHSPELSELAAAHLNQRRHWLSQCQLPNPVVYERKGRTRAIYCPSSWLPASDG